MGGSVLIYMIYFSIFHIYFSTGILFFWSSYELQVMHYAQLSWHDYKCGEYLQVLENEKITISVNISKDKIYYAWCDNNDTTLSFPNDGVEINTIIDINKYGDLVCTFLTNKNKWWKKDRTYKIEENGMTLFYTKIDCVMKFRIKRLKSLYIPQGETNTVVIKCLKYFKAGDTVLDMVVCSDDRPCQNYWPMYESNVNNGFVDYTFVLREYLIGKLRTYSECNYVLYYSGGVQNASMADYLSDISGSVLEYLLWNYSDSNTYNHFNCNDTIVIDEDKQINMVIISAVDVYYAWCRKDKDILILKINDEITTVLNKPRGDHKVIRRNIRGNDYYEGEWSCVFISDKKEANKLQHEEKFRNKNDLSNMNKSGVSCNMRFAVTRKITLKVSNGVLDYTALQNTNQTTQVPYKNEHNFSITCKTEKENISGQFEIFHHMSPGDYNVSQMNEQTVFQYLNDVIPNGYYLNYSICTFRSKNGFSSSARVEYNYVSDPQSQNNTQEDKKKSSLEALKQYGLLGGGVLILSLLIMVIIWRVSRRHPASPKTTHTYENLNSGSQGTEQSFPNGRKLEDTYLKRVDQGSTSQSSEYVTPYATKQEIEDLYSRPNVKHHQTPIYAQAIPKSKRKEIIYADIEFDKKKVGMKSPVADQPQYAAILNTGNMRDMGRGNDIENELYANVFTNELYCNSLSIPDDNVK